ncbi:MAG: DNA-binding protein Alba [Candidatus Njordarchaeia archaeon]
MAEEEIPTIFIGKKPFMRYIMAAMAIILNEKPTKIKIVARGRAISRAVDLAEVLRTRYLPGVIDIENIKISTDEIKNEESGRVDRVSTIEILMALKKQLPTE